MMGSGWAIIIFIGVVVAVLYLNPNLIDSFKPKITTPQNNSLQQPNDTTQPEVMIKSYQGKPKKDNAEFDCKWDSECSFYNDHCTNECNCDTTNGECYKLS